jgi:transposase InsO family protein
VLAAHRATADAAGVEWKSAVYNKIEEKVNAQGGLSVGQMVKLGLVSRSSFYRFHDDRKPEPEQDMELRDQIQKIALEWPCYGRPRICAELGRRGFTANHKKVHRILREDNLLCVRKKGFLVTTDSSHGKRIYPNLARKMTPTDINQLWVADITYIRLYWEFVFLAVILDAHSRRVIGWALDQTLESKLPLAALRMALAGRTVPPGLIHHSDRGTQYASDDYTQLLKDNQVLISMSRKGNPWDNAACESFMKTLKTEEVYRSEYRDIQDAHTSIHEFIDKVYNRKRLHSALGYRPPAEFEDELEVRKKKEAASRRHCRS